MFGRVNVSAGRGYGLDDGRRHPTVATSPSVFVTESSKALAFPPVVTGEIARVTLTPTDQTELSPVTPTERNHLVRGECSASGPGTTVKYRVTYSKPGAMGKEQTRVKGGRISCEDGKITFSACPAAKQSS